MAEKQCYNGLLMNFFRGREDEEKRRIKLNLLFSFQNYYLCTCCILKTYQHLLVRCMVIPLGPHSAYT